MVCVETVSKNCILLDVHKLPIFRLEEQVKNKTRQEL